LAQELEINPDNISAGLITSTLEHSLIVALDEATKESDAEVIFRNSYYGGISPSPLSGEVMGIFSGLNPTVIDNALKATIYYLEEKAFYYSADKENKVIFFPHVIGSIGRLLSKETGLDEGESIAYLIAPPMESVLAFDYALKNSDTRLVKFFKPPTISNMAGGFLTGTLSDCQAAAQAFSDRIIEIVKNPFERID
jgi:ethanolamine utilization protein EutL